MSIQGLIADINNLINAEDIPIYYKQSLEKIKETIQLELQTCKLQICELSDDEINAFVDSMKNMRPVVESQPFINKPCISEGVCREDKLQVLDKIKEEIRDNTYFINEITEKEGIDFETVEKIIDKYKAESEE